MSEPRARPDGWTAALRRMGDSVLGLAQSRLELFTVEFQEEKLRAITLVVWLAVALLLGAAGLLVGLGALSLLLWIWAGYLGLVGLMLVALTGSGIVLWAIRRQIRKSPLPFGETVAEFRKDRECLHTKTP
ncbi:MAG: phage holin family protein [Limisphaerales bacterium]